MAKEEKRIFNLLKPVSTPKTSWDKLYEWLITQARVIIMIALILIVVSFVVKIVVDTEQKNKLQELEEMQRELAFLEVSQEELERVAIKTDSYTELWNNSRQYSTVLAAVEELTRDFVDQIAIQINEDNVSITGQENTERLLEFEQAFKASNLFIDARIQTTEDEEDIATGVIQYSLQGILNPEQLQRTEL